MFDFNQLPTSVLQAGAIFLSIIIEALPFVLIGALISGFIDVFITPEKVHKLLPQNSFFRPGNVYSSGVLRKYINSFPKTGFSPFSLAPLLVLFFLPANVGLFQLSIDYWRKKFPNIQLSHS